MYFLGQIINGGQGSEQPLALHGRQGLHWRGFERRPDFSH
jgi:hypothetical protein